MSLPQPWRSSLTATIVVALLAALVCAVPSLARPQTASAQTYITCPNGSVVSTGSGQSCSPFTTSGGYQYCNGTYTYVAPGQSCNATAGYVYCNGAYTATGQYCNPTAAYGYCNGVYTGNSSCYGANTQYCNGVAIPSGQYCSTTANYASCNGVYTSGAYCCNGVSGTGVYCPSTGAAVTYQPGWNLVSGPTGTVLSGAVGPLYTLTAGTTTYQMLPPGTALQGGQGYWAYFPSGGTSTLSFNGTGSMNVNLPPGQFVMIGNPGNTSAGVSGAGIVLVYDPISGKYTSATQLAPGQGAWAASQSGGSATITSGASPLAAGLPPPPPPPPAPLLPPPPPPPPPPI